MRAGRGGLRRHPPVLPGCRSVRRLQASAFGFRLGPRVIGLDIRCRPIPPLPPDSSSASEPGFSAAGFRARVSGDAAAIAHGGPPPPPERGNAAVAATAQARQSPPPLPQEPVTVSPSPGRDSDDAPAQIAAEPAQACAGLVRPTCLAQHSTALLRREPGPPQGAPALGGEPPASPLPPGEGLPPPPLSAAGQHSCTQPPG
jgi:hypothetical protein